MKRFCIHTCFEKVKIIRKSIKFVFSDFLLKAQSHQSVLKSALEKINASRF